MLSLLCSDVRSPYTGDCVRGRGEAIPGVLSCGPGAQEATRRCPGPPWILGSRTLPSPSSSVVSGGYTTSLRMTRRRTSEGCLCRPSRARPRSMDTLPPEARSFPCQIAGPLVVLVASVVSVRGVAVRMQVAAVRARMVAVGAREVAVRVRGVAVEVGVVAGREGREVGVVARGAAMAVVGTSVFSPLSLCVRVHLRSTPRSRCPSLRPPVLVLLVVPLPPWTARPLRRSLGSGPSLGGGVVVPALWLVGGAGVPVPRSSL